MDLNSFKMHIKVLAVENRWRPAQIQYAEDYIEALFLKGEKAEVPPGLSREHVETIKTEYQKIIS